MTLEFRNDFRRPEQVCKTVHSVLGNNKSFLRFTLESKDTVFQIAVYCNALIS